MSPADRAQGPGYGVGGLFGRAAALLLAALLAAELLARLFAPVYLFNPDRERDLIAEGRYARLRANWRIVSSTTGKVVDYTTNADGYRDLEFPRGHDCLVLAFGNSFTVNWGVHPSEGWPQRLDAELARSPATRGCALRAVALQGWDLNSAYEAAHDLLPELRPRLVLVMFTQMWTLRMPARRALGAQAPPAPRSRSAAREHGIARRGLDLLRLVYNVIERHSAFLSSTKVHVPYLPASLGAGVIQAVHADEGLDPFIRPTMATLDAFTELAREVGAPLVLAVGPMGYEVDETYRYILVTARGGTDRGLDTSRPRRVLSDWAERRGVPVIDLLDPLRAAHREAWTYSPVDLHWNVHGSEVVAGELARRLVPLLAAER